jgi:predicted dehydrogenase
MDLLARGVHTLIEKPLATSVSEADELISAAAAGDAVLQVGHVERFNPAFRAAAPVLREIKYIEARRTGGYTFRSTDIGVVLDLMIHDIDLVLALTGSQVRSVSALGTAVLGEHEDMAQARLELDDGCVVNLTASRTSLRAERTWNVFCPAAYAGIDLAARTVELVKPSRDVAQRDVNLHGLTAAERKHLQEHLFQTLLRQQQLPVPEANPLRDELQDFVTAIQQHGQPHVTGEDGRRALAVAEMVMAAVDQHCWDGTLAGPVGPHAIPGPRILRDPRLPAVTTPLPRRKAG